MWLLFRQTSFNLAFCYYFRHKFFQLSFGSGWTNFKFPNIAKPCSLAVTVKTVNIIKTTIDIFQLNNSKMEQTRRDLLKTITALTGGLMIPFGGQSQIVGQNKLPIINGDPVDLSEIDLLR